MIVCMGEEEKEEELSYQVKAVRKSSSGGPEGGRRGRQTPTRKPTIWSKDKKRERRE